MKPRKSFSKLIYDVIKRERRELGEKRQRRVRLMRPGGSKRQVEKGVHAFERFVSWRRTTPEEVKDKNKIRFVHLLAFKVELSETMKIRRVSQEKRLLPSIQLGKSFQSFSSSGFLLVRPGCCVPATCWFSLITL